jgi:folate-binding protein YgfZ
MSSHPCEAGLSGWSGRDASAGDVAVTQSTVLDRSVIKVSGQGAEKLLNDTLTGRFAGPMGLEGCWFALLSPQGKIQVEGLATRADAAFWLDIHPSVTEPFLKRMKLYRLCAEAEVENVTPDVAVCWGRDSSADAPLTSWTISYSDQRNKVLSGSGTPALGTRFLVPRNEVAIIAPDPVVFDRARVAAGIAELGRDFDADSTFPHDIGMDLLGGVDFVKGCYIGQEVVSRMQHRGTARRRPVIVSGVPEGAVKGAPVLAGGREAGAIGTALEGRAIAILRLDRISDPAAATVGGQAVTLTLPPWATYAFGESASAD